PEVLSPTRAPITLPAEAAQAADPAPDAAEPAPAEVAPAPAEVAPAAAEPEPEAASDVVVESGGGLFEESQAAPAVASEAGAPVAAPTGGFDFPGYVRGDFFGGQAPESGPARLQPGYGALALRLTSQRHTSG